MLYRYVCVLILLAVSNSPVSAEDNSNFSNILVANRVSISIPTHWKTLDENTRKNISAAAEALLDDPKEITHVAALAVSSLPSPPGGIVRVSLIDGNGLTQAELIDASKTDPVGTLKELSAQGNEIVAIGSRQLAPAGIKVLGKANTTLENVGGKLAIAVRYRRTSTIAGESFTVCQYHIPLGDKKIIITLSYREQDALIYRSIINRVRSSIKIR